jgi:hypothetical protein
MLADQWGGVDVGTNARIRSLETGRMASIKNEEKREAVLGNHTFVQA